MGLIDPQACSPARPASARTSQVKPCAGSKAHQSPTKRSMVAANTMRVSSMAAAAPLKLALGGRLAGSASRRGFATSSRLDASYGFIGLGQMGECDVTHEVGSWRNTVADLELTRLPNGPQPAFQDQPIRHDVHPRRQSCGLRAITAGGRKREHCEQCARRCQQCGMSIVSQAPSFQPLCDEFNSILPMI